MSDLYISGLTGTFDTETMITSLLQIKQQPIKALTQKKALVQAEVSSLTNLSSALNDINSFFEDLDVSNIFSSKKATSSDTAVLTAMATSDTPNLTMNITVNKLAQTEMRSSTLGMTSLTDMFSSSGTLTLRYWKDNSTYNEYNVDYSSGQTLQDLVESINSAQSYVKASIYYTGTDYRLLLTESDESNSTKETDEGSFSYVIEAIGMPTELGSLETLQNAQNASIKIGSSTTSVTSASNTFENLITGLDVTVKDTGSATLTISEDYSQVNSALSSFVSNYNSVISIINSITGKGAQFQGDSTITTIKTGFVRLLNPLIKAGLIEYSDTDETISINSDAFNSFKSSDPEQLNDILTTLQDTFSSQLTAWVGAISTYKNIGEMQINSINQKISNLQSYLAKYEERLRKEYAQLESFIYQMNQMSTRIEDFMVTLSEMMKGGKD